ncbi:hypothetical protein Tco_1570632 [Tanacetum coccineum]
MSNLQFADTYNLVAFLAKPTEGEEFEQIAKMVNEKVQLQDLVDGKKIIVTEASVRSDLQLDDEEGMDCLPNATIFEELTRMSGPTNNVAYEVVNEEMNDSLVRAATTASSLKVEQDSGNIDKTQSKATPDEPSSLGTSSGGGPRSQKTMGDTYAQTRFERVSKISNDPLLARDCSSSRDYKFETESQEVREERRVKNSKAQKIIQDWGRYGDDQMFDVSDLAGEEVFVVEQGVLDIKKDDVVSTVDDAAQVSTAATTTITPEEITLAQALQELRTAKPKDKGKGKMVKPEPVKKFSKKDQIRLDEELAFKLQAEEEETLAREKDEANLLAERLQVREQEELTIEERAKLFQQLLEKRRKHFAAKRAEEKRNRPPTKAQQRSIMCTYLKNMEGWKPKDLKNKSFANIQELFEKAMKRVNTFVDFRTELVEGTEKEEGTKKAKA